MHHPGSNDPPRFMLAFFRWFCHSKYAEDIEGDLLERYHSWVQASGHKKATWLLAKEIISLFRPRLIKFFDTSWTNDFAMKPTNWLQLLAVNLLIILMIASPFIPGPANKMVGLFSVIGQLLGLGGLILLPAGIAWLFIEIRTHTTSSKTSQPVSNYQVAIFAVAITILIFLLGVMVVPNPMPKATFGMGLLFQLVAFGIARHQIKKWTAQNEKLYGDGCNVLLAASVFATLTLMYIFSLLFVLFSTNAWFAIMGLLLFAIGLPWVIKKAGKLRASTERRFNSLPVYLVTLPVIAFLTFKFLVDPLSTFSRNHAIRQGESLIAFIEAHKVKTGQYPSSLQELSKISSSKIPKPHIMGVDNNFRYNKINDHYSLSFSQWLAVGSLEEIVLYDKGKVANEMSPGLGQYDYKLDLWRVKGAYTSGETGFENWRYYHCD